MNERQSNEESVEESNESSRKDSVSRASVRFCENEIEAIRTHHHYLPKHQRFDRKEVWAHNELQRTQLTVQHSTSADRNKAFNMQESSNIIVSFRGTKVTIDLNDDDKNQTVGDIKAVLGEKVSLLPSEIKLLWKGKLLSDDSQKLHQLFVGVAKKKTHRLMAMGTSSSESDTMEKEYEHGMREAKLIRDDLTVAGKQQLEQQRQRGRLLMNQSRRKDASSSSFLYGFGKIETLPSLLHRDTAQAILNKLANDPGILACMAKHQWKVGSLAELYPEGKVGESAVCVMGLNKNKGQQILLRIRTDDLCGFRKYLNIKKVLYHELAHNVHSEHDGQFFQLMRQIERECTDLDWTNGKGISLTEKEDCSSYTGGVYTLGGKTHPSDQLLSPRELAARAAETRLTAEEIEIQQNCGCGRANDIFLPKNPPPDQQDHTNDS